MAITDSNIVSKINAAADSYGVPREVALAVAEQESNGKQSAVSSAGAIGVFQLMPSTAKWLGVDPYNVDQNIQGGVSYLAKLYKQFGDWTLALAGYNAGPGNVNKYGGVPPFTETQNYVSKIMGKIGGVVTGNTGEQGYTSADMTIGVGLIVAGVLTVAALIRG